MFTEHVSSVDRDGRLKLAELRNLIREGELQVVTRPDLLARSSAHIYEFVETTISKHSLLRFPSMGDDTCKATGTPLLSVLGAMSEFERLITREPQREGIAKAKAAGSFRGRQLIARNKTDDARALFEMGMKSGQVALKLGICQASAYRVQMKIIVTR